MAKKKRKPVPKKSRISGAIGPLHQWRQCPIGGWTKYWNEVLNPKVPLDPYLVKALIASESDFNPEAIPPGGGPNSARGLMQVTNDSRRYLADEVEELRDFLVVINKKDITDPNLNIAAGVRWLFRKKQIVESKNKNATWRDVVVAYKRYQKDPQGKQMKKFDNVYKGLKK